MHRLALLGTLLMLLPARAGTQQKRAHEIEVHNTIALPPAAHHAGEKAGFCLDPITGQKVYRLSDRHLCSKNAMHTYSYTPQFSPSGRMVFQCEIAVANYSESTFPVYNSDYTLLTKDLLGLTHFSGRFYGDMQWSEERGDVFGISTLRYTLPASLQKFYPAEEAILRAVTQYQGQDPSGVSIEPWSITGVRLVPGHSGRAGLATTGPRPAWRRTAVASVSCLIRR